MTSTLIDLLIKDHDRIRSLYGELKADCRQARRDDEACLSRFRTMKALIVAHAKAEEFTLYALVEQPAEAGAAPLQHFAFEGYEEHDLIDFVMKEMGQAEEISLQWLAQLTVLGEMLDRHLDEEERDFFPKIRALTGAEDLVDLGADYVKERDAIFAKKSGLRPALSVAPVAPHAN